MFTRHAQRALSAHPKLFPFDSGVYRSLRPTGPLDRPEEIDGAALEGLVAQHLRVWIAYRSDQHTLHFRRTRARVEDLRGLATFHEDYPESKAFLVYRGRERSVQRGLLCVPAGEFLSALDPQRRSGRGF